MATAPKKCGKCDKTVYATEEIKCLDKVWHKGCLKCTSCGTTLNIKTVKGYDKMPYCNVHYPQPKLTAVADNPEMQRLRQLQDVQSDAKYHKDFNENKGKFTSIADDPATTRAKEQQRNVSHAEYTGKRKESASETSAQENQQQSNTPEPIEVPVAVEEPSSVAKEPEPTPKSLAEKPEVEQTNSLPNEAEHSSDDVQSKGDSQIKGRALYSYDAVEPDEISISLGDILDECEEVDDGWMKARNTTTGQKGLIPSNYVEIIH
jgi:hypothetical protein